MSMTQMVLKSVPPFPDLLRIALTIGATSASSVIIFGVANGRMSEYNTRVDFRDYALWGAIGSLLGASWSVTGRPWFGSRY